MHIESNALKFRKEIAFLINENQDSSLKDNHIPAANLSLL